MGFIKYLLILVNALNHTVEKQELKILLLQKKLKNARTDPTTGADSLFAYSEDKARKIRQFKRYGGSVLFIDLDNLKRANDRYGHHVGDELLKKLAEISMKHNVPLGRIHRHGGDEFLNIVPNLQYKTVEKIGRRIKEEFDEYCKGYNKGVRSKKRRIAVSIGCAYGKDLGEVIRRSDIRMYRKKQKAKGEAR